MKTLVLIAAMLALLTQVHPDTVAAGAEPTTVATTATTHTSPFAFVDVFIDPRGVPLAAYQFELRTASGDVKLVGIEGGEHAAFAKPPYHDPKALLNDRIVIAAFSTVPADQLPSQKTRVARLMVSIGDSIGGAKPTYDVKLHLAASADAKRVDADISISEGAPQ